MFLAATVRNFGDASDVVEVERRKPALLGQDCLRVKMLASPVNPSDLIAISGAYRSRTLLPFCPGFEGVGTVVEIGSDVQGFQLGDRVVPIMGAGAWQEIRDTEARWCLKVSDGLSDWQAAMSYINPMTAWLLIHELAQDRSGSRVIVNAAGSSIGQMLIYLADKAGVIPIGIVRSRQAQKNLAGLSAEVVMCKDGHELFEAAKMLAQNRVDAVVDCVGGDEAGLLSRALRKSGKFIQYGSCQGNRSTQTFSFNVKI